MLGSIAFAAPRGPFEQDTWPYVCESWPDYCTQQGPPATCEQCTQLCSNKYLKDTENCLYALDNKACLDTSQRNFNRYIDHCNIDFPDC
jgi:hypothetical protein